MIKNKRGWTLFQYTFINHASKNNKWCVIFDINTDQFGLGFHIFRGDGGVSIRFSFLCLELIVDHYFLLFCDDIDDVFAEYTD